MTGLLGLLHQVQDELRRSGSLSRDLIWKLESLSKERICDSVDSSENIPPNLAESPMAVRISSECLLILNETATTQERGFREQMQLNRSTFEQKLCKSVNLIRDEARAIIGELKGIKQRLEESGLPEKIISSIVKGHGELYNVDRLSSSDMQNGSLASAVYAESELKSEKEARSRLEIDVKTLVGVQSELELKAFQACQELDLVRNECDLRCTDLAKAHELELSDQRRESNQLLLSQANLGTDGCVEIEEGLKEDTLNHEMSHEDELRKLRKLHAQEISVLVNENAKLQRALVRHEKLEQR